MTNSSKHSGRETLAESDVERRAVREAKEIREHFTESQIDKILQDTFPASDPPAWY